MKPIFCSTCGVGITIEQHDDDHPHCAACGTTHWQSPAPVAVLLQPYYDRGNLGLIAHTRNIDPCKGGIALPGGFITKGETSAEAAAREMCEESGYPSGFRSGSMQIVCERATTGGQLLTFVQSHERLFVGDLADLNDTAEAVNWQCIGNLSRPRLCFPFHEEVASRWLDHHIGREVVDYDFPKAMLR